MQLPQHTANRPPGQPARQTAAIALEGTGRGSRPPARSLYIHTPFCVHKCHYCDFYSFVDTRDQQGAFVDRLVSELRSLAPHAAGEPLQTIFVGGGTPSLLRIDLWERLLGVLDDLFDLSLIRRGPLIDSHGRAEFTVECNPESATADLMGVLRVGGVTRVSVGAQSFEPRFLKTLERWHDPENVARAIEHARAAGITRQSIDLIFAIPGQTTADWEADLNRAIALKTEHLSCYDLTYEPNTAMTKRLAMGEFEPVAEEVEAEMFRLTCDSLRNEGLCRYEVSNFAKPGQASRHNIAYWLQEQWLAAGPSASGNIWAGPDQRAGSHRWKNVPRLGDYLASAEGFSPVVDHEPPDPARLVRERIMTGLRMPRGIAPVELFAELEPATLDLLRATAERAQRRGQFIVDDAQKRWSLTDDGFLFADGIAAELMACIP